MATEIQFSFRPIILVLFLLAIYFLLKEYLERSAKYLAEGLESGKIKLYVDPKAVKKDKNKTTEERLKEFIVEEFGDEEMGASGKSKSAKQTVKKTQVQPKKQVVKQTEKQVAKKTTTKKQTKVKKDQKTEL